MATKLSQAMLDLGLTTKGASSAGTSLYKVLNDVDMAKVAEHFGDNFADQAGMAYSVEHCFLIDNTKVCLYMADGIWRFATDIFAKHLYYETLDKVAALLKAE